MRFEPMHVTRAVYKAYGIEHPVGDPFGGAAYGELNGGGSFGKYIGSALSIVGGAAMMIGSGGTLAPLLIGGALMAGGAMSAIGTYSGNSTLAKIGTITSAVGGVAALGYGAYQNWDSISNFFSSGTQVADTAGAVNAVNVPATTGTEYAMFGGDAAASINAPSVANNLATVQTAAAYQPTAVAPPSSLLGSGGSTIPGVTPGTSFVTPNSLLGSAGANAVNNTSMLSSIPNAAQTGAASSGGLLSGVGNFIKSNPIPSLMAFQTVAGLAEGASPKSQAEGEYIQAMTDMKNAEQAYLEAQKAPETAANTQYLLEKAKEFEKTKAYEEEKRRLYNESITALQAPQTQNLAQTMYGGAQSGLLNQARA